MRSTGHIGPQLFEFLRELKENNDRDWFNANKKRYEADVKQPLQALIKALQEPLARLSTELVVDPKKSMFRIYRDVRFSKDKSPYKTHAAAQFRHVAGKDVHAPGLYLHLEPGQVFVGAGMWHPDGPSLKGIRDRIVAKPAEWNKAKATVTDGWRLAGDALKRPPRGYDKEHPLIEDLKRKDFIATTELDDKAVLKADFAGAFTETVAQVEPLMRFLTKAVGVTW